MYIIMLGAPGSGKGTIGNIICEHYNLKHFATGDLFREEIKNKTEIGIEAEKYISQGKLVPDDVTIKIVTTKLENEHNILLDGFPRTVHQAEELQKYLESKNEKVTTVINLCAPDEDLVLRTSSRVICSNKNCGASYNTKFMPSKVDGICDVCGSKLIKRPDDEPDIIRNRIKVYYQETEPLIDFYRKQGVLESVNINIYSPTTKEDTSKRSIELIDKHLQND